MPADAEDTKMTEISVYSPKKTAVKIVMPKQSGKGRTKITFSRHTTSWGFFLPLFNSDLQSIKVNEIPRNWKRHSYDLFSYISINMN